MVATDSGSFDYVIIGAGAAGSIVAKRLGAAFPEASILVLEAGLRVPPGDTAVWDPRKWLLVGLQARYEWGYVSTPQTQLNNRVIPMGRARGPGGCGLHNGMVYVRGGRYGYDEWVTLGSPGWSYSEVLPYFERVESTAHVTTAEGSEFFTALVNSCENNGISYQENYNNRAGQEAGVSPFQYLINEKGIRETAFTAYLGTPPPNVTFLPGMLTTRILMENSRAVGVEFIELSTCSLKQVRCEVEVVLSAGSIGSPQILMLSGIGPSQQLSDVGIETLVDLEGVGENLQDDLFVTGGFASRQDVCPQPYGLLGAVIFTRSQQLSAGPTDIECSLASGEMIGMSLPPDQRRSYFIYPNIQLLKSRGTVRLRTASPLDHPLIDPNYLASRDDLARCIWAVKFARQIGSDPAMADWYLREVQPGPKVETDQEIEAYIRATAGTCYHYAGTCKMGTDPKAVVDPRLCVRGVQGLRVVDASIIPKTVSGNTAAATMMIAERGAEFIATDG